MDSKAIAAIAVLAILVVSVACVYVFVLDKDKDPSNHYETLEDIEVGDVIDLKVSIGTHLDYVEEGQTYDFLDLFYFDGEGVYKNDDTVTYKGIAYECSVYEVDEDGDMATLHFIKDSGIVIKASYDDGVAILADTTLDLARGLEEQEVVVGSFFEYDVKKAEHFDDHTIIITADLSYAVTEELLGGIKYAYHLEESGETRYSLELESIKAGAYKFKDHDETYTKAGAMKYYSFSEAYKYLVEEYGNAIVPGEKSSSTIETPYGERPVTVQKYKVAVGEGFEAVYDFYYGNADVLYQCAVLSYTPGEGDHMVATTFSYSLLDCDAVTTV